MESNIISYDNIVNRYSQFILKLIPTNDPGLALLFGRIKADKVLYGVSYSPTIENALLYYDNYLK